MDAANHEDGNPETPQHAEEARGHDTADAVTREESSVSSKVSSLTARPLKKIEREKKKLRSLMLLDTTPWLAWIGVMCTGEW